MDLEMLAPYISMDDDFQLTFLSLSEDEDKASDPLGGLSAALACSRKRYRTEPDPSQTLVLALAHVHMCLRSLDQEEEEVSDLLIRDKRQKKGALCLEEELLGPFQLVRPHRSLLRGQEPFRLWSP